ncbi:MAG: glycosyltransferase family 4 protein [Anaerolineales bacterium]|nr:glycosyltransferase family 4 protein [Anaerolineales bacterium]MDW8325821.1 glycosyltransferase family 4 protein [Anaerolineales bacterium]
MNLLFTLTAYPPYLGGAQLHMHQLARQLQARHALHVVTQWDEPRHDWLLGTTLLAPQESRQYEFEGVSVNRITLARAARQRLWPWVLAYYPLQRWALPRIAAELAAEIAPFAATADLIHNCRIGREGLSYASFYLARQRDVPFVMTPVHHPWWGGWLHRYYHKLYRAADAVIALTQAEREALIHLGVVEHKVFVTGHGPVLAAQADGARFRAQYGLGDDEPLVLFVGQKYAYKGLAVLLRAARLVWRRAPETRFVFIGPRTAYSRRLFAAVGDRRVLELDAVDVQTKTDAFAACDVFCLPSTQESFGGVFTEAWSLGKPVVGVDIPAVRALISDGEDGFLVPPRPEALAERLRYLLEHPRLRLALGEAGRRKVEARYTWERLAALTEQVYQHVLTGATPERVRAK